MNAVAEPASASSFPSSPPASGVVPVRARGFADEMAALQMDLTAQLVELAAALDDAGPASAVTAYVRAAGRDLARLRRALQALRLDARAARLGPLFAARGPLAQYVRATYACCAAVTRALEALLASERGPAADIVGALERLVGAQRAPALAAFAGAIDAARLLDLQDLEPGVRRQWATSRRGDELRPRAANDVNDVTRHLDALFFAVARLAEGVDVPAARRRLSSAPPTGQDRPPASAS